MLKDEELRKKVRAIDLAVQFGRKKQSPRTHFVHVFAQDEMVSDVIPMYENFCFALALFRHKTAESVTEAKQLVERLLPFQLADGNFPIYLHDYPQGWDVHLPLKIAPVLIYILREFGPVLGELKQRLQSALQKMLRYVDGKSLSPLWEMRRCACHFQPHPYLPTTADEWLEWLISKQLIQETVTAFPYHRRLQVWNGPGIAQEKGEPRPHPIEWILAENEGFGARLLGEHPQLLYTALLWPVEVDSIDEASFAQCVSEEGIRIVWGGNKLHSLWIPKGTRHHLSDNYDPTRNDCVEVEAFCDLKTSITIENRKGTVFQLGDVLELESDGTRLRLQFDLVEGSGDFCGHISRANRETQVVKQSYETYDWRIALRTLRKRTSCIIQVQVEVVSDILA
ncbi:MAG: hypothetical protein HY069_00545 [Chlamydiia bacterium]|nr:hypothetical protein [Chlamydiia bacterium]